MAGAAPAYEFLDHRALAALRLVDSSGAQVRVPVAITSEGVSIVHKRHGEAAVLNAPGLAAHADAFDKVPTTPALGSVTVQLDLRPTGRDLAPRRFALALPRTSALAQAGTPASLFQPVEIELLPAAGATVSGFVAALSVTLRRADDDRRIEGALVRLKPSGGRPTARAVTDAAGDALLLMHGLPLANPGPNATVLPDIAAQLDAIVDPALARFTADAGLDLARATPRPGPPIDPDDLESRLGGSATPPVAVRVGCGLTRTAALAWSP